MERSRTGGTLDCHFVGHRVKPKKPLCSSSLSRSVDTAHGLSVPTKISPSHSRAMEQVALAKGWEFGRPGIGPRKALCLPPGRSIRKDRRTAPCGQPGHHRDSATCCPEELSTEIPGPWRSRPSRRIRAFHPRPDGRALPGPPLSHPIPEDQFFQPS
jgi:hypothetical protein